MHDDDDDDPVFGLYCPAPHGVHVVLPKFGANVPATHAVHGALPVALYVPGTHA
jgi:hypothetical protein